MTIEQLEMSVMDHIKDVKSPDKKYIRRLNPSNENTPFISLIRPEEERSGPYSDFSFVVFPDDAKDIKRCIVSVVVGSRGFRNDYDNARLPWWRREFMTLRDARCKNRFTDLESELEVYEGFPDVQSSYGKLLVAARQVDMTDEEEAMKIIFDWLDTYAYLRGWIKKPNIKKRAREITDPDVRQLLKRYKYVVLQGAPGVGKTYNALEIAKDYRPEHVHFIQFHAETTYADFVEGLQPNTDGSQGFTRKEGILMKAIKDAVNNPGKDVLLIIDEINRANLSNVLGPVFFLFERITAGRTVGIPVEGGVTLTHLPDNLHVLGTMNSADRSLAVVDFALRRRFIWVTIRPKPLSGNFAKEAFDDMAQIFRRYADDSELALQPGQAYFITDPTTDFGERLRYELMPLIKEYLNEGLLRNAETAFAAYFNHYAKGATLYE